MMYWAVIPAYNESDTICDVIIKSKKAGLHTIIVDDGSSDDTAERAEKCGADIVIRHSSNKGYDIALGEGIICASEQENCKWVLTLDADGQLDPDDGIKLLKLAEQNEAELAIGIRDQTARMSESFSKFILTSRTRIKDPLCGLKAYHIDLLQRYKQYSGKKVGMEMAVRAVMSGTGFVQEKISTVHRDDTSRFGHGLCAEIRIILSSVSLLPVLMVKTSR